jgi:alpha-glucosidase
MLIMKKFVCMFMSLLLAGSLTAGNKNFTIQSPDSRIQVKVEVGEKITYSVLYNGKELVSPSPVSLTVNGKTLGWNARVKKDKVVAVDEMVTPVVKTKCASIRNHYNELTLTFSDPFGLVFRVFDEGVAYRFTSGFKEEITVNAEEVVFNFPGDYKIWFPEEESFQSHNERLYKHLQIRDIASPRFCSTPALVEAGGNISIALSESQLEDYAGLWLKGTGKNSLTGIFPGCALEVKQNNDRDVLVTKHGDFMAQTTGTREFPWRILAIASSDADLITNQLVYLLARPSQLEDTSWIKPGKVAWDWWNYNNITGVDFRAGVNTETYKFYIDFAAANGLEYIILDEGWYKLGDLMQIAPGINMEELVSYARQKNVGLILWVVWKSLDDKLDQALDQFRKWDIKGIKVDFMQRDDQWMVNYYYRVAKAAAARKLLVDFHGAFKPSGLNRAYPNVITSEGVKGMENCKWSADITPGHDVTLPFIRMWAGPMDFTPGAMLNATKSDFRDVFNRPMSQGTRCHQMAMYVVFESPLQMLCDNPVHYRKEPECLGYIRKVPAVWDETKVLEAKVGQYILVARRSGNSWFLGGMTSWEPREFTVDLSFLPAGKSFSAEIFSDGINADRDATDYKKETKTLGNGDKISIRMAPGGGWCARIE